MRFEAKAALAIGILLPVLETYRRGMSHWSVEFTTMFEDYLAGALLLAGAWAAFRRHPWQAPLLLIAWGWVTGMMTISFVSQVEVTIGGVDLEPQNTDVLVVKFLLLAFSAAALLRSFRFVSARMTPDRPLQPTSNGQVE
ncbi:MAG TPA: hypothetical protein VF701_22095 [Thermoanaerobaculia bacterium]